MSETVLVQLPEDETNRLLFLFSRMVNAPIVKLDHKHDYHEQCTQDVRDYMNKLGEKYNFDPLKVQITKEGKVCPI